MKIEAAAHGDTVILSPKGKITIGVGDVALREAVSECLDAGAKNVIMEFSDAGFIDSSGRGEMVSAFTSIMNRGGKLVLCNITPGLRADLKYIPIFDVYESIAEAFASLRPDDRGPMVDGDLYDLGGATEDDLLVARPKIISSTAAIIEKLRSHPEEFYKLPPRKYEEVIACLLEDMGLEVHLTGQTRDGGKDILAFMNTEIGRLLCLVEAKRFRKSRVVGVDLVRNLYGVLFHEQANSGLLVTTSSFSPDALSFQGQHQYQLHLRDYTDLAQWVRAYGTGRFNLGAT